MAPFVIIGEKFVEVNVGLQLGVYEATGNYKDFQCPSFVKIITIEQLVTKNQFDGSTTLDIVAVCPSNKTIETWHTWFT